MSKISVILAVYNGGEMLKKSINSVLNQEEGNFELLICDDVSTDGSREYIRSLKDERVISFFNPTNMGLFYNLNFLISKTTGSIIKLWSQDDIMYGDCLRKIKDFHAKHPNISFSYSSVDIIDENDVVVKPYNGWDNTPEMIPPYLHNKIALFTGSITGNISNVAINKSVLDIIGKFRDDMKYSADFDMWERLTIDYPIGRIVQPLIQLRNHTGQLSRKVGFSIYQIREDQEVFTRLFNRTPKELVNFGNKARKWKRNVFYFSVLLSYLAKRKWEFFIPYYKELMKIDFLPFLAIRWIIVKISTKFGYQFVKLQLD